MKSDDFDGDDCLVDGEPKHHVLAGDPEVMKLFDALTEKGVHHIKAAFSTEDGSPRIDIWMPLPVNGHALSAVAFFNEVNGLRFTLEKVVLRGLEMSLTDVWDFQNDFVATMFVDVKKRSINVADIHELMFEGDLPNPENGIDL